MFRPSTFTVPNFTSAGALDCVGVAACAAATGMMAARMVNIVAISRSSMCGFKRGHEREDLVTRDCVAVELNISFSDVMRHPLSSKAQPGGMVSETKTPLRDEE